MNYDHECGVDAPQFGLKTDLIGNWMETEWIPQHPEQEWLIVGLDNIAMEVDTLELFKADTYLEDSYRFMGRLRNESAVSPYIFQHDYKGRLSQSTGAFVYRFERGAAVVEVLVASTYFADGYQQMSLACVPKDFLPVWASFNEACRRFAYPESAVMVIGGHTRFFNTRFRLEDVILSEQLKATVLNDVQSFFERGVDTYRSMKLNPFRKILLAGVPGTGKTMLCSGISTWALERGYRVIYVSSLQRGQGQEDGANFWKVQQALMAAVQSNRPSIIILEEMDAYLKNADKALILNVLDGAEADENPHGTLLIATTNYPEAIDERVLKRPGRLDRIYIVPPIESEDHAVAMLRHYLKDFWKEEHRAIAPRLIGYPGSFVREMMVCAITQLIQENQFILSLARLEAAFESLKNQLEERDQFVKARENGHVEVAVSS